jgi:hypothetical protein
MEIFISVSGDHQSGSVALLRSTITRDIFQVYKGFAPNGALSSRRRYYYSTTNETLVALE